MSTLIDMNLVIITSYYDQMHFNIILPFMFTFFWRFQSNIILYIYAGFPQ